MAGPLLRIIVKEHIHATTDHDSSGDQRGLCGGREGLMAKKPYAKMTDKELVRRLFPKAVRTQLKRVLAELNAEPKKARKRKKS